MRPRFYNPFGLGLFMFVEGMGTFGPYIPSGTIHSDTIDFREIYAAKRRNRRACKGRYHR
jgi:hypothetical protein